MTKKILVTGSSGVLGSAIMIQLKRDNSEAELFSPTSSELDLLDRKKNDSIFRTLQTRRSLPSSVVGVRVARKFR